MTVSRRCPHCQSWQVLRHVYTAPAINGALIGYGSCPECASTIIPVYVEPT